MKNIRYFFFCLLLTVQTFVAYSQWNTGSGTLSTSSYVGIGSSFPTTRLMVRDGSFLLFVKSDSPHFAGADFDLGEHCSRFWYNAYRHSFRGGEITFAENNNSRGHYSFGFGKDPKASGSFAVSLGENTSASGLYSLAVGEASSASGTASIALGKSSASDDYSVALGQSSANSNYSFAAGKSLVNKGNYGVALCSSVVDGDYALATGTSYALGDYSIALGQAEAIGYSSIAGGQKAGAYGANSLALGTSVSAKGTNSIVIGSGQFYHLRELENKIDNSLMIGMNAFELPSIFVGPADTMFDAPSFGFVGIGTTTPKHELSVNGTIVAKTAILVENLPGQWPDYVFESDYSLMSLSETEKYIEEHHHLPGVPSASKMEETGVNILEMEMVMMRKIEEITLHLIRMEKENAQLKKELTDLKSRN